MAFCTDRTHRTNWLRSRDYEEMISRGEYYADSCLASKVTGFSAALAIFSIWATYGTATSTFNLEDDRGRGAWFTHLVALLPFPGRLMFFVIVSVFFLWAALVSFWWIVEPMMIIEKDGISAFPMLFKRRLIPWSRVAVSDQNVRLGRGGVQRRHLLITDPDWKALLAEISRRSENTTTDPEVRTGQR